jgi:hypothetical protein
MDFIFMLLPKQQGYLKETAKDPHTFPTQHPLQWESDYANNIKRTTITGTQFIDLRKQNTSAWSLM